MKKRGKGKNLLTKVIIYIYNKNTMLELCGRAKINLTLSIVGTKGGKHLIDSVFYPVELSDEGRAERANDVEVIYTDGRTYENDTAVRTARLIREKYHTGGMRLVIKKGIPERSGLGGSSVDAGIAARAMKELYSLPEIDVDLLLSVGSDAPYFYKGGVCRVRGLGEDVERLEGFPELCGAILVPSGGVDTGECYSLFDRIGGENGSTEEFLSEVKKGNVYPFNALQRSGEVLNGDVRRGLDALSSCGFVSCMTGSGAATFGLTDKETYESKMKKLTERAKGFSVYPMEGGK